MSRAAAIQFIFFIQALAGGGIFTRIADVQSNLGLSEGILGLALTFASLGGLLSILFAGRITEALGTRAMLIVGIPALAILTYLVAIAPTIEVLFPILLLYGMSFSLTNVAMNLEADRVEAATGQRVMNRCHGLWSIGMLVAALVGVGARAAPISPALHLGAIAPVVAVAAIVIVGPMTASPKAADDRAARGRLALPSRRTVILMLFGVSAGIAQSANQNWSVIYMRDTFLQPDWVDTLPLPAFLGTMALSRMFADGWIERFGTKRVAVALTLIAIAGTIMASLSPFAWPVVIGFALIGLGTASLFPMMITAAARSKERPAAESVAAVILVTGLVMMAAPGIMGWIAEGYGLRVAFAVTLVPFFMTLGLAGRVGRAP